ncbi:MAG TPA: kinase/pyrophosphorylase, partial [Atribacteraceae bacterium]|nr:kinase/pyrophosphorylase [Atribacteraceae bacterium]
SIEAFEYVLEKSTGFNLRNLSEADVVLLTMWYPHRDEFILNLAAKGIKCCFLMLDPDLPLPHNLEDLVGKKSGKTIIGFTMNPECLSRLRSERINALGLYHMAERADMNVVKREILFITEVYQRLKCIVIDITNLNNKDILGQILCSIKNEREEIG